MSKAKITPVKVKRSDRQKATMFAVQKLFERMLDADDPIPHGFTQNVSGDTVEITFAPGSIVSRDAGLQGDGFIYKKATQNLYGYPLIAAFALRLLKFNQWNVVRDIILDAMRDVIKKGSTLAAELAKIDKDFPDALEKIKAEVKAPPRKEQTPRMFDMEMPATIKFNLK